MGGKKNSFIKNILILLRLPFTTASIVPVILGTAIAWNEVGSINWIYFFAAFIGVICVHLGSNIANDYFDHKSGNDEANKTPTPFSGGSRVIQDKLLTPKQVISTSVIFLAIGVILGLYLVISLRSWELLLIGVAGLLGGFFYTAPPLKIGYRGVGEIVIALCFGVLPVLGAYYVQAQAFSLTAFLASIPVAVLIGLVLFINEFPDYDADKKVGKKTIVVIMGKENSMKVYFSLVIFAYLFIAITVILKQFPLWALISLLTLPLAAKALIVAKNNYKKIKELMPANGMTIMMHLFTGLLLSLGFILDKILVR
ncbi:1,4-dihydroxy-2-naphthoate octaprenyltransferase [Candidatus Woesearchaeota archaeon]|nr:1,4-dihydroxy-2-naphthoate octaprenyltransferase [Candidatus Woesearchaeota archaeon]